MTSKVYTLQESGTQWTDTTGDLAMTLNNLAAGAARQGAVLDLGARTTARSNRFVWRAYIKQDTAGVVGETIPIYLKLGTDTPATGYDNDDGTGDIAVSSTDKLKNLLLLGVLQVDEAAADIPLSKSGIIEIDERYVMPIVYNNTADNLSATNNDSWFSLTPVVYQGQAT